MFEQHLATTNVAQRVHPIVAPSHEAAKGWSEPIDFLFIDGWHSYEAVIEDGHDWIQHLSDQGVVVFDDATRYPDVRQAIDDLVAEGTCRLYGDAFGQAYAGRRPRRRRRFAPSWARTAPSPGTCPVTARSASRATAEGFGRRGTSGAPKSTDAQRQPAGSGRIAADV